jgi:hypothetical protein
MASAKSLGGGAVCLGSSYGKALPSAKRLRRFFTAERANASVSSTDLSSAVIAEVQRPFNARTRMTVYCSSNILSVQISMGIVKTSAGSDAVGAMKIFEKEIEEEEIIC